MRRRPLSILPCPAYAPDDPTPLGDGGCERCGHRVLDLSAMEEPAVRRLLREPHERICVHARVRRDGSLVLRRAGLAATLSLGLTFMAACAPHVRALELPGSLCEDADGYEIPCEPESEVDTWLRSLPDAVPPAQAERLTEEAETQGTSATSNPTDAADPPRGSDEYDLLGFVDATETTDRSTAPTAGVALRART